MEWILIKTPPKDKVQCVVYDPSTVAKVFPAFWDGKDFGNYIGIFEWHTYDSIKAWQPMPEAPTNL